MNPTVDELLAQAVRLSPDDLELLVLRLQDRLDEFATPEIEAAWIAEAQRRLEAVDRGESRPVPWDEVRKDLGLA
jgi:putative addiction module component (TIGR02574 family)